METYKHNSADMIQQLFSSSRNSCVAYNSSFLFSISTFSAAPQAISSSFGSYCVSHYKFSTIGFITRGFAPQVNIILVIGHVSF
jgi:hypothetical protein